MLRAVDPTFGLKHPMAKPLPKSFHCATEFTLQVLGGKWKTVILCYLKQRPCRYTELRALIPKLSDKVLTERLHDLAKSGLIVRVKGTAQSGREAYALTPKGRSLSALLHELYDWGLSHASVFDVEVGEPLKLLAKQGSLKK